MAAATPIDTALSVGQRIGRYFTLVSLIPSLFLVLWIYVLIISGALSGAPSFGHVTKEISSHWSLDTVLGLVLASFATAIILHPLQFATTQLLEGYWGTTPLAVAAMKIRTVHHRKRRRALRRIAGHNQRALQAACLSEHPEWKEVNEKDLAAHISDLMKSESADHLMLHLIAEQEAQEHGAKYPSDDTRILATQLGNALRCFEDSAGRQYGLDAITIAPHLHLIVPDRHLDYMKDAREDMDSAIRICTVGLVAAALTVGFLLTRGLWLLWTLLPYSVSYLAYKGAVSAAENYGAVVASVIDLDRFLLYDKLGLYQPRDTAEEKESNANLMQVLAGLPANLRYRQQEGVAQRPARPAWRRPKPGNLLI
jgi:hypothetical protein